MADPTQRASKRGLVEKPNGHLPSDAVVEEVQNFGKLDSKIASMAALHRVPGARAEVAMLSLSRAYLGNCLAHGGSWTAGIHLLHWTLGRLDTDPALGASDIRGPIAFSLRHTIAVARWTLIAFRLSFVSDVGQAASAEEDRAGRLAGLAGQAVRAAPGTDPDRLLEWLQKRRRTWSAALSKDRYATLREQLHQSDEAT